MNNFILCHKVGKLTGCDFCGFTFYFDNHLRFFDYSRVNLLIIFHFHFLFFTSTFYFWQPPAFLRLFMVEFAYHFFTFTFYFSLSTLTMIPVSWRPSVAEVVWKAAPAATCIPFHLYHHTLNSRNTIHSLEMKFVLCVPSINNSDLQKPLVIV